MKRLLTGLLLLVILAALAVVFDPSGILLGRLRGEVFYDGRPMSSWRRGLLDTAPGAQTNTRLRLVEGKEEAVPLLVGLLAPTESAEVRWNAAMVLGDLGPAAEQAVPPLIQALEEKESLLRLAAVDALGKIGPAAKPAVPQMAALLKGDEPVRVLKSLRRLRGVNQAAFSAIQEMLGHEDGEVRENACEALGEMGTDAKNAIPRLTDLLKDPVEKVRIEAERALKRVKESQ